MSWAYTLYAAGYDVRVIDVEVPYEISEQRIRQRWAHAYSIALQGGDSLGGRWVPSEYAREVFDGPDGRSKSEVASRALAEQCPAVSRYRVFRTTEAHAQKPNANHTVDVDLSRTSPGGVLMETTLAKAQKPTPSARPRATGHGTSTNGPELSM